MVNGCISPVGRYLCHLTQRYINPRNKAAYGGIVKVLHRLLARMTVFQHHFNGVIALPNGGEGYALTKPCGKIERENALVNAQATCFVIIYCHV